MRSVVLLGSATVVAGLAAVAVVAVKSGSGPLDPDAPLNSAPVLGGGSLIAVGLVLLALAVTKTRRQRIVALLALGTAGIAICVGLRWLHLLLFGIDPGFTMNIDYFAWSLMARVTLFPAVGQMGVVLVWATLAAGAVIGARAVFDHRQRGREPLATAVESANNRGRPRA